MNISIEKVVSGFVVCVQQTGSCEYLTFDDIDKLDEFIFKFQMAVDEFEEENE